ncbi:MAG TPA: hypothetical protein VG326_18125 [Tepidisphaeraceae bacterium]|jgi:hypothetical protein|nr:hypothetical protein [Tepidisphaeraceae bacterium]
MRKPTNPIVRLILMMFILSAPAAATPTENNSIRVLPAPGKVVVDGKTDDWDLSGGIFICDDVQTQRDTIAVWLHAMYDKDNLYLLAHFKDQTPLNNPGQTLADFGFAGDSLQVRIVTHPGEPDERGNHFTAWRGVGGSDVITMQGGKTFKEPTVHDVKTLGAQQGFSVDADGKGYVQEIALPWKILTRDGSALTAGATFTMTAEPNFTVGINGRMSIKDLFKANMPLDRVFTFQNFKEWGPATLEAKNDVKPQPVRLADAREFNVRMEKGFPVIDWTGLIQVKETPGFKAIAFEMPRDGYISLNIKDAQGHVVRQLLNAAFFTKGRHEVKWDGLPTPNLHVSGLPLAAGSYTWSAIYHDSIGLKLRGWAHNGGEIPWDNGPASNWGGDFGPPVTVASNKSGVYLGWSGAEAGKAIVATDLQGHVRWNNKRGGIGGVTGLAADDAVVYVLGGVAGPASAGGSIYKLSPVNGSYLPWGATPDADLSIKAIWEDSADAPDRANAIATHGGKIYLSFASANKIAVVDGKTGKLEKTIDVKAPGSLWAPSDAELDVISGGASVIVIDLKNGSSKVVVNGLSKAAGLVTDGHGRIYVGMGDPDQQIRVHDSAGKTLRSIGRPGGRVKRGAWDANSLLDVNGLALDGEGKLWAAEATDFPKRVSVWNAESGSLWKEFFGPTTYGALGGAINPVDPNLMVGNGCEWRLDPKTGRASCVGVITREGMGAARFATGANGRLYLFVAPGWNVFGGSAFISVFERVGDADYKLRGRFIFEGKGKQATTKYWADANGDEQQQPDEITTADGHLNFNAWYLGVAPDMSIYIGRSQWKVTGFTPAGAPLYDLAAPTVLPATDPSMTNSQRTDEGLGSADGRLVLYNGNYMADRTTFRCFDIASGTMLWSYPNNFVGVHGSHNATGPEVGMIRGAFGIVGTAKFPKPIGNLWAIGTNVGEWHLLTEDGFYLTRLFQPDPLKVRWPSQAVPGADMTETPPGMGGEDFGGAMTLGRDGNLYVQAGKTAFWNLEVTGLDTVRAIPGGTITLDPSDLPKALAIHEAQLQQSQGAKSLAVRKRTPVFTGKFDTDFKGDEIVKYQKGEEASARSACAWDNQNLYIGWDVKDATPWTNGARAAEEMYVGGDTVDFQLGADPAADKSRTDAGMGDLRLSIGAFDGKNIAVLYRRVAKNKKPQSFSSGVFHDYKMDYVSVLDEVKITAVRHEKGYTVEAAIPLSALDVHPDAYPVLRGDFGVTYGDPAGQRTRLRSYWSDQKTGIVDDNVAELMMQPKNWGELTFKP